MKQFIAKIKKTEFKPFMEQAGANTESEYLVLGSIGDKLLLVLDNKNLLEVYPKSLEYVETLYN